MLPFTVMTVTKTLLLTLLASGLSLGQTRAQVFSTKAGKAHFFSDTPVEDIEATTNKAEAGFLPSTGQVSARIQVNTFTFESALMQRHFNENYLETDKYPYATLEGKLAELTGTKDGSTTHTLKAKLTMHGVTKEYAIPITIEIKGGVPVRAKGKFPVRLADHNIEIPKIVFQNISEIIDVDVDFPLEPKKK